MAKPLAYTHTHMPYTNVQNKAHGHIVFRRIIVRVDKVYVDFCSHNYSLVSPLHFHVFCLLKPSKQAVLGSGSMYTIFSFFSRRKWLVLVFLAKQNENTHSHQRRIKEIVALIYSRMVCLL